MPHTPLSHAQGRNRPAQTGRVWSPLLGAALLVLVLAGGWLLRSFFPTAGRGGLPEHLRIGFAIEAPYAYLAEDGRVTGESIEIARRVAAILGYDEPEWVLTDFGSLVPELREGRFDVVAAGLFVTPERARQVAFSRPTLSVRPALLVASGNPRGLHAYADLANLGHVRVAAVVGSVEATVLAREGVPTGRIALVPDPQSGMALLKSGRVDALALSRPTLLWQAARPENKGKVETADPFHAPESLQAARVAHAFRHEDEALRRSWDRALDGFLHGDEHRAILHALGLPDEGDES